MGQRDFLSNFSSNLPFSPPHVMGILNITPNSFSAVGRFQEIDQALAYAEQMATDGAAIIDIGGEPTNPGVHPVVSLQEELDRVIPVVEALSKNISIPISVDTSKPEIMRAAIAAGASMINDVRALQLPGALEVVAEAQVPVCLMHMNDAKNMHAAPSEPRPQGSVAGVSKLNNYPYASSFEISPNINLSEGVLSNGFCLNEIKQFLQLRVEACIAAGISRENIILDPGIGGGHFGKTTTQNLQILANLSELKSLGFPILIGVSRKMFIGEILDIPVEERLYGSLAAAVMAVANGASIIRAHDVKATVQAMQIANAIIEEQQS